MNRRKRLRKHFTEQHHRYKMVSDLCVAVMGAWMAEALPQYLKPFLPLVRGWFT